MKSRHHNELTQLIDIADGMSCYKDGVPHPSCNCTTCDDCDELAEYVSRIPPQVTMALAQACRSALAYSEECTATKVIENVLDGSAPLVAEVK